jgi:gamma-glutamylcyclotransferase (GGCT)/AIG2-like uncharacterized protein YtfP
MREPYFSSTEDTLILDGTPIKGMFRRSKERNAELRKFTRFMANGPHKHGSIYQFAHESPLDQLGQGRIQSVVYEGTEIPLPHIDSLKNEAYVVYDDSSIHHDQVEAILKAKAGLPHRLLDDHMKFNLVTMMLPSYIYKKDGAHSATMMKIKIFNYTYLNFNSFSSSLGGAMRQNVTSMIRLNLLTVCYEAQQQRKHLPFIINPPGAFVRRLSTEQKGTVAQIISDAVSEIGCDKQIHGIVSDTISEWIFLRPDFWSSRPDIPHRVHFVQADVCDIAEQLWKKHRVLCPLPMMGAPTGAIGNGALGDHAERALDEFLFRTCGGIHGIVGSLRYNPTVSILPLSQIVSEMERSLIA